jgi:DNA-binding IclR family transcriptional regulator
MRWALDDAATVLHRIRSEFREMPGLRVTLAQAARLWHLDAHTSESFLNALVVDGLLRRNPDGAYVVSSDPACTRLPRA